MDTVFGYPGGAVLPLYDALHGEPRLRHVLVRHEQAAVHAAQGYARSTGRLGVVFVTSGPGVANTTSGLLDAKSDSIPVLCVSGQVATAAIGTVAFQECDALGISRTVTKWNVQIADVREVETLVRHAVALATTGRPRAGAGGLSERPAGAHDAGRCSARHARTCAARARSAVAVHRSDAFANRAARGGAADRRSQAAGVLRRRRARQLRPESLRGLQRAGAAGRCAVHAPR